MAVRLMLGRGVGTVAWHGVALRAAMEPFRTHSVTSIRRTTLAERVAKLAAAHHNLFLLSAADVYMDLLTDSGTGAMSAAQWAAMITGDESYAGSSSFDHFARTVHSIMPNMDSVFPVHQGRAAERILALLFGGPESLLPNNTHFDTTRANFEFTGTICLDLPTPEALDPTSLHPFKGNMDLRRLRETLEVSSHSIPAIIMTVTNNACGGQPVSMENLRAVSKLAAEYQKPFFIDGCRFAENAHFIKTREVGYENKSILEIAQEMFSLCNGMWMSAKKDAIVNNGGFLCFDDKLGEMALKARDMIILSEGFPTYGGMAGRDLDALAVGLREGMDEDYLAYRVGCMEEMAAELLTMDIPIIRPVGGHAIFVDAGRLLPHIPALQYPGHAVACALYILGGIRSVEIGSLMFGARPDGSEMAAPLELTRLAFPRRVYSSGHQDYVLATFAALKDVAADLNGYAITHQPPRLRHFSAHLQPIVAREEAAPAPLHRHTSQTA